MPSECRVGCPVASRKWPEAEPGTEPQIRAPLPEVPRKSVEVGACWGCEKTAHDGRAG
jgi:hypothetical protein